MANFNVGITFERQEKNHVLLANIFTKKEEKERERDIKHFLADGTYDLQQFKRVNKITCIDVCIFVNLPFYIMDCQKIKCVKIN